VAVWDCGSYFGCDRDVGAGNLNLTTCIDRYAGFAYAFYDSLAVLCWCQSLSNYDSTGDTLGGGYTAYSIGQDRLSLNVVTSCPFIPSR